MPDIADIEIAGVNFSVACRDPIILKEHIPAYKSFLKTQRDPNATNVRLTLELNGLPDIAGLKKIFDGDAWSLFKEDQDYLVAQNLPPFEKPVLIARFDPLMDNITVYLGEFFIDKINDHISVSNPVTYPLDQILMIYFLAKEGGALMHAAGIAFDGRGYLFPGRSGAGKSTLSRQFVVRNGWEILSDDRIVVRKINGDLKAFGTPWPGESGNAINKEAPLSGIFFISHASDNKIRTIGKKEAFERLLPVTSIPWYDCEKTTGILDFCENMISSMPAYELHFRPDGEVVDVLERFLSR